MLSRAAAHRSVSHIMPRLGESLSFGDPASNVHIFKDPSVDSERNLISSPHDSRPLREIHGMDYRQDQENIDPGGQWSAQDFFVMFREAVKCDLHMESPVLVRQNVDAIKNLFHAPTGENMITIAGYRAEGVLARTTNAEAFLYRLHSVTQNIEQKLKTFETGSREYTQPEHLLDMLLFFNLILPGLEELEVMWEL